jgi:hypothetical protein
VTPGDLVRNPLGSILTIPLFVSAMACASEPAESETGEQLERSISAAAPSSAAAASADSVVAWAEEIQAGIAALPAGVTDDPDGARQRAVELYVTRQERIEQASGPGTGAPADLAESVHQAEARFHELMQLLGATPPPDSAAVHDAVLALDARLAEVVDRAAEQDLARPR